MKLSKKLFELLNLTIFIPKRVYKLKISHHMIQVVYITFPFWQHTGTEGLLRRGVIAAERFAPIYIMTKQRTSSPMTGIGDKPRIFIFTMTGLAAVRNLVRNRFLA